jgi:hypothetical protein
MKPSLFVELSSQRVACNTYGAGINPDEYGLTVTQKPRLGYVFSGLKWPARPIISGRQSGMFCNPSHVDPLISEFSYVHCLIAFF